MNSSTLNNTTSGDGLSMDDMYGRGDASWILVSSTLVFLMIPGLGYFYSGMAQSKNSLSLIFVSIICVAIVCIEWIFFGYSLALSPTSTNPIIGNFDYAFLMNILDLKTSANKFLPEVLFVFYQGMFASITPALTVGAIADRGRILPALLFAFIWSVLVYNFVAYWTWGLNGWGNKLGALDYAGGTPVHITSGFSALVYSIVLGKRHLHGQFDYKPHNMSNVVLGTSLLWFGWFGFNGGSALASNTRAALSCINTNVAASFGGLTWLLIDYFWNKKKLCVFAFCSGVVAGLVTITPAAGFVDMPSSLVFGFVGAIVCNLFSRLKDKFGYDDALDVFSVHGVGGFVGSLLTGIFARSKIAGLDPSLSIKGGWLDGNFIQIVYQLAVSSASAAWASLITLVILLSFNLIKILKIRVDSKVELDGIDYAELGHHAYPQHNDNNNNSNSNSSESKINEKINNNQNKQ